ncbi:MAG: hypothetical protein NTV22_00500 [bacterium]|nr:hypothetical protein [bacterium]
MSDARAHKALRGAPTDCLPLFDQPGHPGFLKKLTGIDPFENTEQAVAKAGAAGLFLDTPCVTLEEIVKLCGKNLVYFTGPAPATMRCGTPARVREEIRIMAETARELPRFFFHMVGSWINHL